METKNESIKIDGLFNAAYRAFYNISFYPEKRAETIVNEHEKELNDDIRSIPESEHERYIEGYKKHLFAWLSAKSRCLSAMITGPANFPVRRNEKANQAEHARLDDFIEWRNKALKSIAKKVEAARPQSEKNAEMLNGWKKQVDRLFEGWLVDRFRSRLETVAITGNVELVNAVLDYFSEQQEKKNIILATKRHGVWKMAEVAEKHRVSHDSAKTAENTEIELNGVRVVRNEQADRIQLFFDGKPDQETIAKLKKSAFRWSPSNGCWQRQLTQNSIHATNVLLTNLEIKAK